MINDFKKLLNNAGSILVTSHISPDPDAISSLCLVGSTFKLNFPHKSLKIVTEEEPSDLAFIHGYELIDFDNLYSSLTSFKPDLFILLDGNNFERCSRKDGQQIRDYVAQNNIKLLTIDHHELAGADKADLFINRDKAATAQEAYDLLFNELGLKKPPDAAEVALTGFYADTGGFVYIKTGQQDQVFDFAKLLVNEGANVESVKYSLESYSDADFKVLAELAANVAHENGYSYSFLGDKFIEQWLADGHAQAELNRPNNVFLNNYIRNIEGRSWGFIVYKNTLEGENAYSVSLRSQGGKPDVSQIARKLGGGGHKPAAGARFEASSVEAAIAKVKQTIL